MNKIQKLLSRLATFGLLILAVVPGESLAAVSPIGLSVIPPAQIPTSDFSITGVRASLFWGNHREVYGFDLGVLGNITQGSFGGIAVAGGMNWNQGSATVVGLQAAGLANVNQNKTRVIGLQVAGILNSNSAESTLVGAGLALVNLMPHTTVIGVQAGLYNSSRAVYGFQFGLFNFTESLHGVQLGLLNFNKTGLFSVAPFLNIGF
jgi:hypothetical protein